MVNCGILTKGFDYQDIIIVAICFKSESRAKLNQVVGRGGRLVVPTYHLPNKEERKSAIKNSYKPFFICIDFFNNQHENRLGRWDETYDYIAEFYQREKDKGVGDAPMKQCPKCFTLQHPTVRNCIGNFYDILTDKTDLCSYEFPMPKAKLIEELKWFQAKNGAGNDFSDKEIFDRFRGQENQMGQFVEYLKKRYKMVNYRKKLAQMVENKEIPFGAVAMFFIEKDLKQLAAIENKKHAFAKTSALIAKLKSLSNEYIEVNYSLLRRNFNLKECEFLKKSSPFSQP
jgi:superfamily II DNA or RNA helicase